MNEYNPNDNINNIDNLQSNNVSVPNQSFPPPSPNNIDSGLNTLNSASEENNNRKSPLPKIIIFVLVIIVVITSGLYCYKSFIAKPASENSANLNDSNSDKKDDIKEENNDLPKESIDYVSDADYKTSNLKESYIFYNRTIKLTDIVVPYLNIETPAAEKINNQIESLYKSFVESYTEYSNENLNLNEEGTESYDYIKSSYTYNVVEDILSILIKVNRTGRGSSEAEEYYTFNYDLKEEKELYFTDLCNKLSLNYEDSINKANEVIETTLSSDFEGVTVEDLPEIVEYIKQNKEFFANQIKDNKVMSFIDEKNEPNIIVYIEHPLGGCGFYWKFVAITK